MRAPDVTGTIERRLLLNYRVDPEVVAELLPPPFRPHLSGDAAVAGICFVALRSHRPRGLPALVGLHSQGAAHRFAVEWDDPAAPDGRRVGVYIRRRDTASLVNRVVGGRLFPGEHEPAHFVVEDEPARRLRVAFDSGDGAVSADVTVEPSATFSSATGLFADLASASAFFEAGALAYSETRSGECFDGVELLTPGWRVEPVRVVDARSSFFDSIGSLDGALLMRDIPVRWHARPRLVALASSPA